MATFSSFVSDRASGVAKIMNLKRMQSDNHLDSLSYGSLFVHVSILIV